MKDIRLRLLYLVLLLFILECVSAEILQPVAEKDPPNFSDTYVVKGTLYIPYAEIREPFFAWYDMKAASSRIDYYGGMVKTYQLGRDGKYGSMIKVAPVTTEKESNVNTCLRVNGTSGSTVQPQSILPDLNGFQYLGEEPVNGLSCEKWRLVDTKGDKVNKYTIWLRYKKSPKGGMKDVIPVKYEMKGYNTLLGSHFDHYFLMYEWYRPDAPNPDVFKIESNLTCTSFPGPGHTYIVTFNPMQEFIDNYEHHVESEFDYFKHRHNKNYDNKSEHTRRKEIFRQNYRFINSKNRAVVGFQMDVNHLTDRTDDELKVLRGKQYTEGYNGGAPFPYNNVQAMVKDLPGDLDWRIYGAVTPVKDQSVCGSCWSFGTTGTIEGAYFLKHGRQVRLSQQALIDCSWGYGNNGCDGGEDFRSYEWIMKHGGIPLEDEYGGYLGQDGYCHIDSVNVTARLTGYVNVTSGDVDALKVALAKHGPISIAIDASRKTFSFYSNGIYYDPECHNKPDQLDHAVLLVGYGSINGNPYWLVKNSWSNYWGNDGYVLISQKDNNCGVATDPTYVTM